MSSLVVEHENPLSDFVAVRQPRRGWQVVNLFELWRYRELLWMLATREIKVRYKQTIVGAAWAVLQPLATMVVLSSLFKLMGRFPTSADGAPYAVSLYCALLPWQFFAGAVTRTSESLIANQALITKVYFPRVLIPVAELLSGLIDFLIAFSVLALLMAWYAVPLTATVLILPALILYTLLVTLAIGLWTSALNSLYRDLRYALPFLIQLGFFLSPVMYETRAVVPDRWQTLYYINPMACVLDGFRWAILGKPAPALPGVVLSLSLFGTLLAGGLFYFRRMEQRIVDTI